jgi:hypothetical protein
LKKLQECDWDNPLNVMVFEDMFILQMEPEERVFFCKALLLLAECVIFRLVIHDKDNKYQININTAINDHL